MRYYLASRRSPGGNPLLAIVAEDNQAIVVEGEHHSDHLLPYRLSEFFVNTSVEGDEIQLYAWDPSAVNATLEALYPLGRRPKFVPHFVSSIEQTWRDLGKPRLSQPPTDISDVYSRAEWARGVHTELATTMDAIRAPMLAQALRRRMSRARAETEDKTREQCAELAADHIYKTLDTGASISRADAEQIVEKIIRSSLSG